MFMMVVAIASNVSDFNLRGYLPAKIRRWLIKPHTGLTSVAYGDLSGGEFTDGSIGGIRWSFLVGVRCW